MSKKLEGKVAVVTGGSKGIGASIAKAKAPQIQVTPQAPRGFCMPPGGRC